MIGPGDLVICIDDSPPPALNITKGVVYTVLEVDPRLDRLGEAGIKLVEVETEETEEYSSSYRLSRFKPIRKPSIEIFTDMLTNIEATV